MFVKEITTDFNGIILFEPSLLRTFYGGSIEKGDNLWRRFTTTEDGDAMIKQGIIVPIIGINDGTYDVCIRLACHPEVVASAPFRTNGVFPLHVVDRLVVADVAVLLDWEDELGWHEVQTPRGFFKVTTEGFRHVESGAVTSCGYTFILERSDHLPEMTASLERDMQVLTLDH